MKTNIDVGSNEFIGFDLLNKNFVTNADVTNMLARELLEDFARPVEDAPTHQIIGTDGAGWYQLVGHVHDVHAKKSALAELRQQIRERISSQIEVHKSRPEAALFKALELAIIRSDSAVFRTAELFGIKPSSGLYGKIAAILVAENEEKLKIERIEEELGPRRVKYVGPR